MTLSERRSLAHFTADVVRQRRRAGDRSCIRCGKRGANAGRAEGRARDRLLEH